MKKICLVLIIVALSANVFSQKKTTATPVDRFAGLDTAFERVLKDWHAAGFAVAVVEKDKIVYAKGFGYKDYKNKMPVTPNTQFAIGSCTKAFTSSLIGLLEKDDKLDIDKPVSNYLPGIKFYNDGLTNAVTLRDMMSHRTGLPRHDYSWYAFPSSSRDSLVQRIQYMEPSYPIRQKWQYNNFMFLLQGTVAEKITGKSWEENIREHFFKPLNMVSSNFTIADMEKNSDHAIGYGVQKDSIIKKLDYYHIDAMGPAGSINSNVNEMANWLAAWINGGKFNGKEILPAGYRTEAMSSQMIRSSGLPSREVTDLYFSTYGFGWMMSSYKGHYRVEHGGNIDGFSANACFFPTDSVGIVVLTNQNASSIPSIVRNLIADRLLKLPYFDWNKDQKTVADKAKAASLAAAKTKSSNRKPNTVSSHPLKDYDGLYTHPAYGNLDINIKGDSLFATMGKNITWLRHYHYDIFEPFNKDPEEGIDTTATSGASFQFQMNSAGEINAVSFPLEPTLPALTFKRILRKKELSATDLQKYTGEYLLGGQTLKVYIKNEKTLFVLIPGQPEYELVATGNDKFGIKILNGYYVQFDVNDKSETTDLTFLQPNGNFKAKKK